MKYVWLSLVALASPAPAQSTRCYNLYGSVVCDTPPPIQPMQPPQQNNGPWFPPGFFDGGQQVFNEAYAQAERARRDRQARQDAEAANDARKNAALDAQFHQELRQAVGEIASEGRCDDAINAAMKGGDFEAAQIVKQTCTPK